MQTPPRWALELTRAVYKSHGRKKRNEPTLVWKRASRRIYNLDTGWRRERSKSSHGVYYGGYHSIVVHAGYDPTDTRLVLLHELAHSLTRDRMTKNAYGGYNVKRSKGHSMRFWKKAWRLYAKYGVPLEYAKTREWSYKVKAKAAYYQAKPYKKQARG